MIIPDIRAMSLFADDNTKINLNVTIQAGTNLSVITLPDDNVDVITQPRDTIAVNIVFFVWMIT